MAERPVRIITKRTAVPGKIPTGTTGTELNLIKTGELASNLADKKLFSFDGSNVFEFGTNSFLSLTGGTISGDLNVIGTTYANAFNADTISATTYLNLPPITGEYLPLSGGTVSGDTVFEAGITANTLNVLGLTQTSGITSIGGIVFPQKTISSSYTAQTEDYTIDVSGGTFSIYLPSAVGIQGKLYNVKNNGGGAVTVQPYSSETIDEKSLVILGETNAIQLVSNGFNWVALGYNISTVNSSTGVFEFTGLTKVTNTTFNVAPIKGWIVDDTTNPLSPQLYYISYSGGVHTDNYVTTSNETFVYLTSGGTIGQQTTNLTSQQRRQNIFLGKLGHPDKTAINLVFSQPDFVLSPLAQLRDMFSPINLINGGVVPSTNGANLKFNTNAGYLYGLGINFSNDTLNPNSLYLSGTSPCTFQYRTQTGGTTSNVTDIDPTKYDVGGVVTNITGTKATNQRIYLLQNGSFRVMYGQQTYNTLTLAIEALQTETFVPFPNFVNNAVLIGILTVLSTATDLTDTSKARFFFASKFGETVGAAGGISTTTLQQAYNNSSNPEIITNSVQGGIQFRGGTGSNTDKNIIIENNSGIETSFIKADGSSLFTSLSANTIQFNTSLSSSTFPGELTWNSNEGTLNIGMAGGNVVQQVGLESYYQVINSTIATGLTNGSVIRSAGVDVSTGKIVGQYMIADGSIPYYFTLGIATEDILSGNTGYVNNFGIVRDVDTTGSLYGETWLQGDILYVSPTIPGGLTNVVPSAPNLKIQIALVLKLGVTDGVLFIRPTLGAKLGDLHNVENVGSESNGDLLVYSASSSSWVYEKTLNGNYQVNGSLSATTLYGDGSNLTGVPDYYVTGGTYSSGTLTLNRNGLSDINITGFTAGGGSDTYVTGFTYNNANILTIAQNQNQPNLNVTINTMTGLTVSGALSATTFSGGTYYGNGSGLTGINDYYVTGGTFSANTLTLNRQNGSVTITGFTSGAGGADSYWTSGSSGSYSIKAINTSGLDAVGNRAVAINSGTTASGNDSFAQGQSTIASGMASHAEGYQSYSIGFASHAEGSGAWANGQASHSEGSSTTAFGNYSHSEGSVSIAGCLGYLTDAGNPIANGLITISSAYGNVTSQFTSPSIYLSDSNYDQNYFTKSYTLSSVTYSGGFTRIQLNDISVNTTQAVIATTGAVNPLGADTPIGNYSHAEGISSMAFGNYSHSEGFNTATIGDYSHVEGEGGIASGYASHAEGRATESGGDYSHSEGYTTSSVGYSSHAEGSQTKAFGSESHAEGVNTTSLGDSSHAEGRGTISMGDYSHAEGSTTTSIGFGSHSQGDSTIAVTDFSFASGSGSTASGEIGFIHSSNSLVSGNRSVVLGGQNITGSTNDTVYVPNFNINTTPTTNNSLTNFLVRESSGDIRTRDYNSINYIPNLVTVGLSGGSAQFTSIKSAVDSITGASATNTYVVKVGPGSFYEDTITMKSYVDIFGESETNTIIQANNPNAPLIIGADQSMVNNVQIQGCSGTGVSAIIYSSSTTPQLNAIFYVENVRFGANYTHVKNVGTGGGNSIIQCSNVKYGGYPFTLGFYCTNDGSGIGRMQLRNVTSTNGGVTTSSGLVFAKADKSGCGFIVNGCLLTKAVGAAAGTGFWVEDGGFLRLTAVNFQRWSTGIYAPQVGSAPSIDAIALNFENCTKDVDIIHSGATGKIQGTDNFLKTNININAPLYEVNTDPREIIVAKKGGDFSSIKAAVDYLAASATTSSSSRYVISVGPGEFAEGEIDLTSTPYVSIVGSNIQTTLITPTGNTQHIIKIGINNEISFLSLSGAPSGYAGIYCYDIGDFAQAHKVSFYDCDTNVWVESSTQDTQFFGEYLDFNGVYSYGTKVVGNNNYLALANMENYYNYPESASITYCNYATGSGATLSIFIGDNLSNGVAGSVAYYIQDGASLNASTITADGFTYGIRNPNIGDPIVFDVDNASFVNGDWDLYIERVGTFGTFAGSSSHQKLYTISSDVYWSILDVDDGEFDITRKASVTFEDGTHTDFTTLLFEGSTMGLMEGGEITHISGFTFNTATGYGYLAKVLSPNIHMRIDWSGLPITLGANENKYIFINENGILTSSGTRPSSVYNIVLGRVVTNSTSVEFIDLSPSHSDHTSNRFGSLFRQAMGPIYASGSIVTENATPFRLDVTSGEYYYSTSKYLPTGGTAVTFTEYYRDGVGGWNTSATTIVNSASYDGNGSLSALSAGYYTKHTLYVVGDNSYEKYFLVLGQNQYSTLVEAEDALLPIPPTFFTDSVSQIANIYIQQGATGITQVEDIRPVIGFKAGGVNASSVHGNLLGLGADDHTQYLLVSGGRSMSGDLDMGGNDITNVSTVDGVDVSSHATRHQFGGADQVGTTTPSPNAIPYADVSGKLDDWISSATTSTRGLVKMSIAPTTTGNPIAVGINDPGYTNAFTATTYSANTLTSTRVNGTTSTTTIGLSTKAGSVAGTSFAGNPKKYTVTFTTAYPNTNYSIQITGGVNRTFTYESKATTGFVINANSNTSFTENVDWVTIGIGES